MCHSPFEVVMVSGTPGFRYSARKDKKLLLPSQYFAVRMRQTAAA
jgi:hypothetical protein